MTIDIIKLAEQAGPWRAADPEALRRFAALHRAAVVQELLGTGVEPVASVVNFDAPSAEALVDTGDEKLEAGDDLYTADQAAAMVLRERQKSVKLWMLLDDVDTADDMAKADDRLYRKICQAIQAKRWEVLTGEEVDAIRGEPT